MGTRGRRPKSAPILTVVSGGLEDLSDVQPSIEGLQQYVTAVLKKKGKDDVLTHEDVLNNSAFVDLKRTCEAGYKAQIEQVNADRAGKRKAREVTLHQKKLAAAKEVNSELKTELGQVLTQEQINARLKMPLVGDTTSNAAVKPANNKERLLALKQQFGSKVPGRVFDDSNAAVMFRIILISCIKPYHVRVKEQGLEATYLAAILALRAKIQDLITMADEVIMVGWDLDLRTQVNQPFLHKQIADAMSADDRFTGMMKWRGKCPTPEDIAVQVQAQAKLDEAKKAPDAQKAVAEAAEKQRREKLRQALKTRLLEIAITDEVANETPEQKTVREKATETVAGNVAARLTKKYGHLVNAKAIFIAAAIDRKKLAETQPDENAQRMISWYVRSAELTQEELDKQEVRHSLVAESVANSASPTATPVSQSAGQDKRTKREHRLDARREEDRARARGGRGKKPGKK